MCPCSDTCQDLQPSAGQVAVISGARGVIGAALAHAIRQRGGRVRTLSRRGETDPASEVYRWDIDTQAVDPAAFEGASVVYHLAGEPVLGRWTARKRARILDSRVDGTHAVVRSAAASPTVRCIVSASAIGYYGYEAEAPPADEQTPAGAGFLAEVVQRWEGAAHDALPTGGPRLVLARIGVVLTARGGALFTMIRAAHKARRVAVLGSGDQWVSWVSLEDAIAALQACASSDGCAGPVNIVAPRASRQRDLAASLAGHLDVRLAKCPALAISTLAGGDFAREVLLGGRRATPSKLESIGFRTRVQSLDTLLDREIDVHKLK